jgi:hypothetical protein
VIPVCMYITHGKKNSYGTSMDNSKGGTNDQ